MERDGLWALGVGKGEEEHIFRKAFGRGEARDEGAGGASGTYLQGKENREPAHHARALGLHRQRVRTKLDAGIKHALKVSGEPVADAAVAGAEREAGLARVVGVCGWGGGGGGAVDEAPDGEDVGGWGGWW